MVRCRHRNDEGSLLDIHSSLETGGLLTIQGSTRVNQKAEGLGRKRALKAFIVVSTEWKW